MTPRYAFAALCALTGWAWMANHLPWPWITALLVGIAFAIFADGGIKDFSERFLWKPETRKALRIMAWLIFAALPPIVHPQFTPEPPPPPIEDLVIFYIDNVSQWGRPDIAQFPLDEARGLQAKFIPKQAYRLSIGIANKIPETTLSKVWVHIKVPMDVVFQSTHPWRWEERLYPTVNLKVYAYEMRSNILSGTGKELDGDIGLVFLDSGDQNVMYTISGTRLNGPGLNLIERKFKIRLLE